MKTFLLAGFPSPWRWWRREFYRYKFNSLSKSFQELAKMSNIAPETLIKRGLL